MTAILTIEEIKAMLFAIPSMKAPGLDEILALFYTMYWHVVGEDLALPVSIILDLLVFVTSHTSPQALEPTSSGGRSGPPSNLYVLQCFSESSSDSTALETLCVSKKIELKRIRMPKDRRIRSFDASRGSPYPCSSRNGDLCKSKTPSLPVGNEKEWEEARCPICIEHPHNAVLLLCSSSDKGCRPYMCDTSHRHSNCLDQFCLSSGATKSTEEAPSRPTSQRESEEWMSSCQSRYHWKRLPKLVCPLCRGQISACVVVEAARQFMNSKPRICSLATCDFSGRSYSELRKHARLEHPSVCPSEADPRRQRDWTTLEHQRLSEDFLSAYQQEIGVEWSEGSLFSDSDWMVMGHRSGLWDILGSIYEYVDQLVGIIEFELSFPYDSWFETSELGSSRSDGRSGNSRSTTSRTTSHTETVPAARWGSNFSLGSSPGLQHPRRLGWRQSRRNN
ncbi:unnamed protein product [Ilex paraguariensis]|uniref:Uncharacterized protein n=1 Tax=Ilex paraguariensis TaxID=185542 RepID=A0ABC8RUR1_9AQUA